MAATYRDEKPPRRGWRGGGRGPDRQPREYWLSRDRLCEERRARGELPGKPGRLSEGECADVMEGARSEPQEWETSTPCGRTRQARVSLRKEPKQPLSMRPVRRRAIAARRVNTYQRWPSHRRRREVAKRVVVGALSLSASHAETSCGLGTPVAIRPLMPSTAKGQVRGEIESQGIPLGVELQGQQTKGGEVLRL